MSTKIEWAQESWNPIVGCSKVSPGCDNCYAENMAGRIAAMAMKKDENDYFNVPGLGKYAIVTTGKGKWNGKTYLDDVSILKPLSWRKPRSIFICSMGDLFHESVPFEWIDKVMAIAALMPKHTFMLLTKRPERMKEYFSRDKDALITALEDACYEMSIGDSQDDTDSPPCYIFNRAQDEWPYKNIWLGVSAENQEELNKRILILLQIQAAKHFVSVEPMLGPADFKIQSDELDVYYNALTGRFSGNDSVGNKLDWVICGGESGPGARPLHPDWVRSLRDQCFVSQTPFFFKQWGEWLSQKDFNDSIVDIAADHPQARLREAYYFDGGQVMFRIGKKAAGRKLDGKIWDQYPTPNN